MTPLRLVADHEPQGAGHPPRRPFDLTATPLRPGIAHDELGVVLDFKLAERVEEAAAASGLPAGVWAGLVIESERALALATGAGDDQLAGALDQLSTEAPAPLLAQRSRRLVRYGMAIRGAPPRPPAPATRSLRVVTTQHATVAWELAAAEAQQPVQGWALRQLAGLPSGRELWEAASAIAGVSLGEWVAVQAARRCNA